MHSCGQLSRTLLEPMESCRCIMHIDLGHKNCIFLFLALFRPNTNPVYLEFIGRKCLLTVLIQNTLCQQRYNLYQLLINNNDLGRGEFGSGLHVKFGLLSPLLVIVCAVKSLRLSPIVQTFC